MNVARIALPGFISLLGLLALGGCGPKQWPTGPAPEYEEPPAPRWLDGGASDATSSTSPPTPSTAASPAPSPSGPAAKPDAGP